MPIPFTQFLMPNGRPSSVSIERPVAIEDTARLLISKGVVFEIEMLSTGLISMEAVIHGRAGEDPQVLASELCPNGPEVPLAVDKMVRDAERLINFASLDA